jgi:transposase-like protein/IS1 family transposase
MDPQHVFCPNPACPARGQTGRGNITIHSQRERRYRCTQCRKTFSDRVGTPFYRQQYPEDLITLVITLLAHGCPLAAIVVAFGLHWRTVARWREAAGAHAQAVHEHLVEQPRNLGQVQADELRIKTQSGILWVALAIQVPTRLWLGGAVSVHRDKALIRALAERIARCALLGRLLVVVDGLSTYVGALQWALRTREARPGRRPRRVVWPGLVIGQVIKQYAGRRGKRGPWRVTGVVRRVAVGTWDAALGLLEQTQGAGVLNTAYIERLNGTFRQHLASLGRRTRHLACRQATIQGGMYLIGTVYNFCTYHQSLALRAAGRRRTPAMAAGLTDHRWSVGELLAYHVPLPRWQPPKQRGRRSKAMQELIDRWAA